MSRVPLGSTPSWQNGLCTRLLSVDDLGSNPIGGTKKLNTKSLVQNFLIVYVYKIKTIMKVCENCGNEHGGTFGSGRFCCKKCARGFSTKEKRSLINKTVSKKLTGTGHKDIEKKCPECGKMFKIKWNKRHIKTCSRKCGVSLKFKTNLHLKEILSKSRIKNIEKGIVNGSGIKCVFKFNKKNIKCDSKLEYTALDYFVKNYNVLDINRANIKIEYEFNNEKHIFLPDFKINTSNGIYIVECKSEKITSHMQEKWKGYIETSKIKKEKLIDYCKKNNFLFFWFTQYTSKDYRNIKI